MSNYKILLINLDRSPDRFSFMSEQFEQLNLPFERIPAIDGTTYDFTNEYNEGLYKKHNQGTVPNAGIKGCALSHRNAMQKMLDGGLDYALIMEDDIELNDNFKEILIQTLRDRISGKTAWEYLSFNYPSVGWKSIHLWLFLFFEMAKKNLHRPSFIVKLPIYFLKFIILSTLYLLEGLRESLFQKIYKLGKPVFFYRPLYLAGCYLISRTGAEKLIKLNTPISYTADGLPNAGRLRVNLKHRAFVPLIARQKRSRFGSTLNQDMDVQDVVIDY